MAIAREKRAPSESGVEPAGSGRPSGSGPRPGGAPGPAGDSWRGAHLEVPASATPPGGGATRRRRGGGRPAPGSARAARRSGSRSPTRRGRGRTGSRLRRVRRSEAAPAAARRVDRPDLGHGGSFRGPRGSRAVPGGVALRHPLARVQGGRRVRDDALARARAPGPPRAGAAARAASARGGRRGRAAPRTPRGRGLKRARTPRVPRTHVGVVRAREPPPGPIQRRAIEVRVRQPSTARACVVQIRTADSPRGGFRSIIA